MDENELQNESEVTERKSRKKKVAVSIVLGIFIGVFIIFSLTGWFQYYRLTHAVNSKRLASSEESAIDDQTVAKLESLERTIRENYLNEEEVSEDDLEDALYHGLVDGLGDRYSTYYSKEEMVSVMESSSGIYYGIGAYISYDDTRDYCKISGIMEDTPAEEAGLLEDDIIVEVDGESMQGATLDEVVSHIKGELNTEVVITVYREGDTDYQDITVKRGKIETPTVSYEMLEDDIGYLALSRFESVSVAQFRDAVADLKAQGMKGMILDLRSNPGGLLNVAVDIAGEILPPGLVVYTVDRAGHRDDYGSKNANELGLPLVVLVNGNSASAAEVLSGAIRDSGKGTIVGTTTFGKGIVQQMFSFSDGSAVKLTISHYYTPAGTDIHEVGIEPDIEAELDVEAYREDGSDSQLDAAIKEMKKQLGN
ncbi:MAG: PDZ domain-containing protein [Lachnospiraceae bacterium]|nr:PDZ domain-containing protein [Lachnospiraceae bacterium]